MERYTDPTVSAGEEQALETGELLEYIRHSGDFEMSTLDAILAQTEAIGDPALPTAEQVAILRWLDAAQKAWEEAFPVEEPLASQLRSLNPLVAALAISDSDFLTPGAHPMHQILDTIQASAIGWQSRLGRGGQGLERQVTRVIESALTWFDDREADLAAICSVLNTATDRDLERTQKMVQRVVETEQGRVKTAQAKQQAAGMINALLRDFPAPAGIGEFLRGPWYASAQLVLLKHGVDSEEWCQMSATTHTLLDSLQIQEGAGEERHQHIFETVTALPKELKRWLLNLHHDSEAVDDAVGLVEYAHLRVLRDQPLVMEQIEDIAIDEEDASAERNNRHFEVLDAIEEGQWFSMTDAEGPLRAQLVLKMEDEQQLLFTNRAGIKALQQSYEAFARSIAEHTVTQLHSGASFSACLAAAAGIDTQEKLDTILGAAAEKIRREREEAERQQREEEERLQREREEAERLQREQEERLQREREEAERLQREQAEAERLRQDQEDAEQLKKVQEEAEWLRLENEKIERMQREQEEAERQKKEQQEAARLQREREEAERATWTEEERQAWQQAEDERLEKEWEKARLEQEQLQREEIERARQERIGLDGEDDVAIDLPMGVWLGFHDGDTPLLAKLAVHDTEQDQYFFVNREGIKMRQLSKQELLSLMERGLVEVMQSSSNFRDEVTRIRSESE